MTFEPRMCNVNVAGHNTYEEKVGSLAISWFSCHFSEKVLTFLVLNLYLKHISLTKKKFSLIYIAQVTQQCK